MSHHSIWREYGTPLLRSLGSGPPGDQPLRGRTVAVKDLFAVAGFPTGAGNPRWLAQARLEPRDAWAVRALRAAGAAIAGIAQTDELAFSLSGTNAHYGTPPNPAAPGLVTGGSSSGPAAAVAVGQADIGLGTDTAGSVRVPASVCGLFGLRPTHGAVPTDGVLPLAPSFDTVGWLTADAALLAAVGSVLLPPGATDPPRRLVSPEPQNGCVLSLASALGLPVATTPVLAAEDITALLAAFRTVQGAEAWEAHGQWIAANPGALDADVEARFLAGAGVDLDSRKRAADVIADYRHRALEVIGPDTWLVQPVAGPGHGRDATPADKDAWRQATLRNTVLASAFGLPSCVIPSVLGAVSPPEGLALVGPPGADHALLGAAVVVAGSRASGARAAATCPASSAHASLLIDPWRQLLAGLRE